MARNKSKSKPSGRLRALPWAALLQGGVVVTRRLRGLSGRDRARLLTLIRDSRGWPGRLGERERSELRKLLGKLDLRAMGRELAPLARRGGRGRKRR